MAIKLEIKNLYKIFGEHPQRAFKYIEQGLSKEQILEKTGLSLGVKDAGNDSNLLIVFYVQIMPDDLVMQLHR
ncbi:hypothetical protein R9K23_02765, partial [Escherichia coli]